MKKLILIFGILLGFGSLLIQTSCERGMTDAENEHPTILVSIKSSNQNPFDFMGEVHNAILDSFAIRNQNVFKDGYDVSLWESKTKSDIEDVFVSVWEELGGDIEEEDFLTIINAEIYPKSPQDESLYAAADAIATETIMSFLDDILALVKDTSIYSSDTLWSRMSIIEISIQNSELSELDEAELLSTAAVAKYSWDYWREQYELDTESFWYGIIQGVTLKVESPPTTGEAILVADATGAAIGAIRGGISGAMTGTVVMPVAGTLTGAITGAVIGGATTAAWTSGAAAIIAIIDWW